ncbi:hypothetical protein ACIBHY_33315 [Nonomuraea sp. NPDC050547]|uniref:hypothetical protein n=1 Tax=Nonomuraea sp. NPDC050547 TaxID=3364368 RepID=UPI00379DBC69
MADPLEAPRSADDLYLSRSADRDGVPVHRPIVTGDVFADVEIPGVERVPGDDQQLAMIVSHPCSMRQGARLNDHVQVIRVVRREPIRLEEWPKRYYDLMPLPDLTVIVDPDDIMSVDPEAELAVRSAEGAHAGFFELRGRVESPQLKVQSRIACLSEHGVGLLHQRMTHHDTRHSPRVEQLVQTCAAVFAEIELWELWNERLIPGDVLGCSDKLADELDRVAVMFDEALSAKRPIVNKKNGFYTLRGDLGIKKEEAKARRAIHRILEEISKGSKKEVTEAG